MGFLVYPAGLLAFFVAFAQLAQGSERLNSYVLVKLAPDVDVAELQGDPEFSSFSERSGIRTIQKVFVEPPRGHANPAAWHALGLARWHKIEFVSEHRAIAQAAARLERLPTVDKAVLDNKVYPAELPNDPDLETKQWSLKTTRINAPAAWDVQTDCSDFVTFVIDTGVQIDHPDLQDNLWRNPGEIAGNDIDDDGNGYIDDVYGWNFAEDDNDVNDQWPHGTHVNGIIGATTDNNLQVAGVCWRAKMAQAKIFSNRFATWEKVAQAFIYAADNGARVTNNSWGGGTVDAEELVKEAIAYAKSLNVVQIAAAGNSGSTTKFYPAAFEQMIAVSSTTSADELSGFSNHGDWIDLSAPGSNIHNTWINGTTASKNGTSMAAPHVAGAAALIISTNLDLTPDEVRRILRESGDDLGEPGFDIKFGHGRLNVGNAINTVINL